MQQPARISMVMDHSLHAMLKAEQRQNIAEAAVSITETHREEEDKTCKAEN